MNTRKQKLYLRAYARATHAVSAVNNGEQSLRAALMDAYEQGYRDSRRDARKVIRDAAAEYIITADPIRRVMFRNTNIVLRIRRWLKPLR